MIGAPRPVALLTSDPDFPLSAITLPAGARVSRHSWLDGNGPSSASTLATLVTAADPLVLCIAADVPLELALDVCAIADRDHSGLEVVLVTTPTPENWARAARVGVRDLVAPDAVTTDLVGSIEVALDRAERVRATMVAVLDHAGPGPRVIVVVSPKGGSGKTMIATNLAVSLAAADPAGVALVDLDSVFGDAAGVLGITPDHTIGELARLGAFDSTTLKVFLARHEPSGLFLLASSASPEEGETVTADIAGRVLELLAGDFAYLVVDTSAGLDERTLAAIDRATDIVMVASLDVSSVRDLGKEIHALNRLGITGPSRHFVLNRADARVGIEVPEVEEALGMRAMAKLPSTRLIPLTMNQGRSIVLDHPDSPVSHELTGLASQFLPESARVNAPSSTRGRGDAGTSDVRHFGSRLFRRRSG
jgi:pilus assembly protein CpaE